MCAPGCRHCHGAMSALAMSRLRPIAARCASDVARTHHASIRGMGAAALGVPACPSGTTHMQPQRRAMSSARQTSSRDLAYASALGCRPSDRPEVREFRDSISRWVAAEVTPHVQKWEDAQMFPRELYKAAAELGLLQAGYPEEYGGVAPGDVEMSMAGWDAVAESGCGGVGASLASLMIGLPPIISTGTEELKREVAPQVLAGDKIQALAITEPSGGSDVANLRTTARRDGDHYIVNGEKTFITSGMRADFYTVAVRTGDPSERPGAAGVSLLLVRRGTPGFSQAPLRKMGWHASDTATLSFEDCRVPVSDLIGPEHEGFRGIMLNFNYERLMLAIQATGMARACFMEALDWARERQTFGRPLVTRQVIRHKLVDMATSIEQSQAMIDSVLAALKRGEAPVAQICMLKNVAVHAMQHVSDEAVQILGGSGFMLGSKSERVYREVKVMAIGGGATEIMRDLAARQMRL